MSNENLNPDAGQGGQQDPNKGADPNAGKGADPNAGKGTIVTDPNQQQQVSKADWPDDWRAKLAGDDKDLLKQLGTLGSPQDMFKSYRELQKKISSGEYKKALQAPGKDATPEQLAEYRKDMGIPETPDKYDTQLDGGLVIGEQDKPIVDAFLKEMHAAGASNAAVKAALNAYYKIAESQRGDSGAKDDQTYNQVAEDLRKEWGGSFKRNQNAIAAYVGALPEGFRENLIGARLADGSKLLGNAEGIKFILQMAKEANPAITVVPDSANPGKTIDEEIKSLAVGSPEYWKSPEKQARARELYAAQDALANKQKRA